MPSRSYLIVNIIISNIIELLKRHGFHSQAETVKQLDDFDQDIIFGNAASQSQENTVVIEGTKDRDLTIDASSNTLAINENTVNVKTLESCLNEGIDREMSNIVDTVKDRIQNAILTTIGNIVAVVRV